MITGRREDVRPGVRRPAGVRRGWIARAVALAVAGSAAVAAAVAWRAHATRGAAPVAGAVAGGQVLAPLAVARDAATGEETAPFSGFAVSVDTEPPGALVSIDGNPRGEAPVLAGIDCAPGRTLELRAEKGALRAARTIACRRDTLVKTILRLAR